MFLRVREFSVPPSLFLHCKNRIFPECICSGALCADALNFCAPGESCVLFLMNANLALIPSWIKREGKYRDRGRKDTRLLGS